jgi:hypothetical protein
MMKYVQIVRLGNFLPQLVLLQKQSVFCALPVSLEQKVVLSVEKHVKIVWEGCTKRKAVKQIAGSVVKGEQSINVEVVNV